MILIIINITMIIIMIIIIIIIIIIINKDNDDDDDDHKHYFSAQPWVQSAAVWRPVYTGAGPEGSARAVTSPADA